MERWHWNFDILQLSPLFEKFLVVSVHHACRHGSGTQPPWAAEWKTLILLYYFRQFTRPVLVPKRKNDLWYLWLENDWNFLPHETYMTNSRQSTWRVKMAQGNNISSRIVANISCLQGKSCLGQDSWGPKGTLPSSPSRDWFLTMPGG